MRAERFLEQYREQMLKIVKLKGEINALDDLFSFTQDMTSEKVQSSPKPDRMGELIARKVDKTEKLNHEIEEAYVIMGEVKDVISKVRSPELQWLLSMKYIELDPDKGYQHKTWAEIEMAMGFDSNQRWVYKLRRRALNEVERILNDL